MCSYLHSETETELWLKRAENACFQNIKKYFHSGGFHQNIASEFQQSSVEMFNVQLNLFQSEVQQNLNIL